MERILSPAHLAGILDIADDAIIAVDDSLSLILFNKGAERMFGYTEQEALGKPLDLLLPECSRAAHVDLVRQFGESRTPARRMAERSEIGGRRKDGSEFPAEASISCLDAGEGRVFTAIVRDVTAQKRHAQKLRSAKQAAEAAVQAKSMFLANMSHEIRTPLNAIIGMTSLLLHTSLADEQRDFVETIRSSGDALLSVINDILDFTKIELGSLELDIHRFDLRRAIEGALDLVASTAAQKDINLAYFIDDGVPAVLVGDGSRLRQILLNILSNAVKFTRRGEVVVNVEAMPSCDADYELHVSVSDTGIGISAEEQQKLFRPFSQVDASTTREYGGTGLGLAISQRLCEMLGGRIWVESRPAVGSTFHFTMLARKGEALHEPYLRGEQPALAGKRLLIVDDNTTNRRVLVKHALKWGMLPQAVASPQEALDLVRHGHALDVAILDMSMPHMDGVQLAGAIRQSRDARSLPLVLLSSMGQRHKFPDGGDSPFAAHLHKPIKASQLFDVLMTLVGSGPAPDKPVAAPSEPRLAERLPLKLLVAEDNVVNQKVVQRMLAHLGYIADVVATGVEVLEAVDRQDYDVILMDIQMPDMDGMTATRRILERFPDGSRPFIIAMTANALRNDRDKFLAAGMDGYLGKPLDLGDLASALERSREPSRIVEARDAPERSLRPVLDESHLRGLAELPEGPALLREVAAQFEIEMPRGLAALREHAANADAQALGTAAHRLASTALACGAVRVGEVCREIEHCGLSGRMWLCNGLFDRLAGEYAAAKAALAAYRDSAAPR